MTDLLTFTLKDKNKPYVRMTRRGKFCDPQAQQYLVSRDAIMWQLKNQMAANGWQMLPERRPLQASLRFVVAARLHGFDLDNAIKAVLDAGNEIKPPRLLYASNLSPQMFREDTDELVERELLKETEAKRKKSFSLTTKGFEFLEQYKTILAFIDNFGL